MSVADFLIARNTRLATESARKMQGLLVACVALLSLILGVLVCILITLAVK